MEEHEGIDESAISKVATSMPLAIALPKKTKVLPPMERKTSLTERSDVLVPPLMEAMREKGVAENTLGLEIPATDASTSRFDEQGNATRSASISRQRGGGMGYTADPGAVVETLAGGKEESEAAAKGP